MRALNYYIQSRFLVLLPLISCLTLLLLGCNNEGSYPLQSQLPIKTIGQVSNISVKDVPGGAVISYNLPKSRYISYVEAVYTTNNGETKRVRKASHYNQEIKVDGFVSTSAQTVKLYTVSRGKNPVKSKPVAVTIHPLVAPYQVVYSSIKVNSAFGGIHVSFQNPDTAKVVITILQKDPMTGDFNPSFRKYTKVKSGSFNIRVLKNVPQKFGYYVRNRYNSHSDTTFIELTPLFETKINPKYFSKPSPLFPSGDYISGSGNRWTFSDMWDEQAYRRSPYSFWISKTVKSYPVWFAIDLGQVVQLSRFVYHGRPHYNFTLRYPKKIKVWGAVDPKIDPDHPFKYWTLLGSFDTVNNLPDGLTQPTAEIQNAQYGENGISFTIPDAGTKPPIRYFRFEVLSTWGSYSSFVVGDFSFFGQVIKTHNELNN
jgi:hypothetical protein